MEIESIGKFKINKFPQKKQNVPKLFVHFLEEMF